MADIELVIKIPEDVYTRLFDNGIQDNEIAADDVCEIARAIRLGTPLPKGHGRLIDERQVVAALVYHDFLKDNVKCGDVTKILDMTTIIEADKETEE